MSLLLTTFNGMPRVREAASKPQRNGVVSRLRRMNAVQAFAMCTIATIAALSIVGVTVANEYHSNPWLLSWIPAYCCVTNDCCWEVAERDLFLAAGRQVAGARDRAGAGTHQLVAGRKVLPLRLRL